MEFIFILLELLPLYLSIFSQLVYLPTTSELVAVFWDLVGFIIWLFQLPNHTVVFAEVSFWPYLSLISLFIVIFALAVLFAERKLIAASQKRLGISFLGSHGWVHLPADVVKFWLKQLQTSSPFWTSSLGGALGVVTLYLGWLNLGGIFFTSDGVSTAADLGDYSLLLFLAYAVLTTLFFFFIVCGTRSKYATIAGARLLVVTISFDVFSVILWGIYCGHVGGYAFDDFYEANSFFSPSCALPPLALAVFMHTLVEANRAPFDHAEAESELVAGHLTEFGGRTLLFMYICEYVHVFFSIFLVSMFVIGGPWGVSFLPYEVFFDVFFFFC